MEIARAVPEGQRGIQASLEGAQHPLHVHQAIKAEEFVVEKNECV
jgi:hypothetical protein